MHVEGLLVALGFKNNNNNNKTTRTHQHGLHVAVQDKAFTQRVSNSLKLSQQQPGGGGE